MSGLVAVVGSANLDIVLTMPKRPDAGETLLGTGYHEAPGGKGANQAIAAAKITGTAFIGSVGRDSAATRLVAALEQAGVDATHVLTSLSPTGRAYISLTPDGESTVVVLPMANGDLTAAHVTASLDELRPSAVLSQLEVPSAVTAAVVEWCRKNAVRLVLNPALVHLVPEGALALADPLIANAGEARALLGLADGAPQTDEELAVALAERCRSVVLTAGRSGAFVASGQSLGHVEGMEISPVDTTGAGDTFAGTLTAHLVLGTHLVAAAALANAETARLVQFSRVDR